ncbi:MAG: hypothetical protein WAN48_08755 [Actinomycetes bacterium]
MPPGDDPGFFASTPVQSSTPATPPQPASLARGGAPLRAGEPSHVAPTASRWAKSDVTFGPVGRVVSTVLLVLPMLFFVATGLFTMDPFVLVGAAIWFFFMVTGLRHVWRPVARR